EGYAAATSRRIAEEAGVKQQLVYYYFRTMDELLLETFKRRTAVAIAALEEVVASDKPIQALWENMTNRTDNRLNFEFMALANHHDGMREEITRFITESRKLQGAAIARQLEQDNVDASPAGPGAIAFLLQCISIMLGREASTGITEGHDEVRDFMNWAMKQA
ncbi:MAG: helix-turn-helix transcriptional regulator, partial [Novosphingobium sp.]|nr:helix-turn-helix transcriptional regulator [Novosphingobium sp.]